jgi:hypothetical protein
MGYKNKILLIINVKIFSIFKRNGAHLVEKKGRLKKTTIVSYRDLKALNMQNKIKLCQALSM